MELSTKFREARAGLGGANRLATPPHQGPEKSEEDLSQAAKKEKMPFRSDREQILLEMQRVDPKNNRGARNIMTKDTCNLWKLATSGSPK